MLLAPKDTQGAGWGGSGGRRNKLDSFPPTQPPLWWGFLLLESRFAPASTLLKPRGTQPCLAQWKDKGGPELQRLELSFCMVWGCSNSRNSNARVPQAGISLAETFRVTVCSRGCAAIHCSMLRIWAGARLWRSSQRREVFYPGAGNGIYNWGMGGDGTLPPHS